MKHRKAIKKIAHESISQPLHMDTLQWCRWACLRYFAFTGKLTPGVHGAVRFYMRQPLEGRGAVHYSTRISCT